MGHRHDGPRHGIALGGWTSRLIAPPAAISDMGQKAAVEAGALA